MFKCLSALAALAAVLSVSAQSQPYGQCGGTGWSGATTCTSGWTCTYSNAYYSQCLPGSATTTPATPTTSKPATTTTAGSSPPPSGSALTGPTSCTQAGSFTLCQNLWGRTSGVGSQNSTLISASGNSVSWSTSYTWANNPNNVKSYANVQSNVAQGIQLSALKTAPTSWSWTYQSESSGIRADVSYDIWLGTASSGAPATTASSYEIMIWLSGQGGIQPVGSAIQSGISLAGHTWTLWSGPNSNWNVFSFVSANGDITNFSADLKVFFDFLVQQHGVSSSQYLQAVQSGTEPFTGTATLVTNSFSVSAS